jgi:hypothetical protein
LMLLPLLLLMLLLLLLTTLLRRRVALDQKLGKSKNRALLTAFDHTAACLTPTHRTHLPSLLESSPTDIASLGNFGGRLKVEGGGNDDV